MKADAVFARAVLPLSCYGFGVLGTFAGLSKPRSNRDFYAVLDWHGLLPSTLTPHLAVGIPVVEIAAGLILISVGHLAVARAYATLAVWAGLGAMLGYSGVLILVKGGSAPCGCGLPGGDAAIEALARNAILFSIFGAAFVVSAKRTRLAQGSDSKVVSGDSPAAPL